MIGRSHFDCTVRNIGPQQPPAAPALRVEADAPARPWKGPRKQRSRPSRGRTGRAKPMPYTACEEPLHGEAYPQRYLILHALATDSILKYLPCLALSNEHQIGVTKTRIERMLPTPAVRPSSGAICRQTAPRDSWSLHWNLWELWGSRHGGERSREHWRPRAGVWRICSSVHSGQSTPRRAVGEEKVFQIPAERETSQRIVSYVTPLGPRYRSRVRGVNSPPATGPTTKGIDKPITPTGSQKALQVAWCMTSKSIALC